MYGKKNTSVTVQGRFDITEYVHTFVMHMRNTRGRIFDRRRFGEVENMKELMNRPENTTFKSMRDFRDGGYFWDHQDVDFVPSNLKRGYIFYFLCNGCGRRVKYLYEYSSLESPLCRICCRLSYQQPGRKARTLSRIIRKPSLSREEKFILIKQAGITLEDIVGMGE